MNEKCFTECDKSVELEVLWDSGVTHSEIRGVLYIRGDCVPIGTYTAHWDGTEWTLELPEGVIRLGF